MKRLLHATPIGGSAIVRDYLQESPASLAFFAGSPFRLDSYRLKLAEVTRRFGRSERERAARALRPASDAARVRLDRFIDEGGAMITTGQQAGFLTGPLYTIYKAMSAVLLARHLEESLGVLVLPVFWVASEDHDWAEANHAVVLNGRNRARTFTLETSETRPLPMSDRQLEGNLDALCDEIIETIAIKQDKYDYIRKITDPYRVPGRTVGGAFGLAVAHLLEPFDVCIADAADPALKAASAPVLRAALAGAEAQESRLAERTAAIERAGYRSQVAVLEGATNIFLHAETGRERLYRRGEDFSVRERKTRFEREGLLEEVALRPELFSPNVFLRPVVESWVFPTLAYVGGPGEIAYFAQANALFEEYGVEPPMVMPRYSGRVVEPRVERLLTELGLDIADAAEPREQLIERLARREIPEEVGRALQELRGGLVRGFEGLMAEVEGMDSTLTGAMGAIRNRSLLNAARAERKIIRAIKRGDRIALEKLDRVLDSLRPNGAPQDRVLNVLTFLARFGGHFLREVERAIGEDWRLPVEG